MSHIDILKAAMSRRAPVKASHFYTFITPPTIADADVVRDIPFMAESSNLPTLQFSADPIKHKGYGMEEQRPAQVQMDNITLTMRADAKGETFDFCENWMKSVFNFDSDTFNDIPSETFNYPSEYYGTLEIHLYDNAMEQYRSYKMIDAWPINMGAPTLSWGETDNFMKFSISFAYRGFKTSRGNSLSQSINSQYTLSDRDQQTFQKIETDLKSGKFTGLY